MGKEEFVDVYVSKQVAEKHLKKSSPYIKKDSEESFHEGRTPEDTVLYFIREKVVKE